MAEEYGLVTSRRAKPAALKRAEKIAEEAAGRRVSGMVWIKEVHNGMPDEYSVCYSLPRSEGWYICNVPLWLSEDEYAEYQERQSEEDFDNRPVDKRADAANNETTPPPVLSYLARDRSQQVRANVAWNKNTPPEVLAALAEDDSSWVRENVAENENTTTDALFSLVANGSDTGERKIIQRLIGEYEEENMKELFDAARQDGMAFKYLDAFREAYDYTYGEGAMGNPMLAANIFAEPREN